MGIVLDTSVLIAAEKQQLRMRDFSAAYQTESFFISAITAAELLHGVERATPPSRKAKRSQLVEHFLSSIPILDFDLSIARRHAALWAEMARSGFSLGPYDLIIAASALEHGHSVATLNSKEFARTPKLKLIDLSAFLDG